MKKWLSLLVILVALVYRNSFTSPFFQDDLVLLNLAKRGNFLQPIANFPYRPVSQPIFYWFSSSLFGANPVGFHWLLFLFFIGTLILVFKIAGVLLKDNKQAIFAAFFYATNVSLFANFYWIATSYFTIGAFFFFLTIYFYLSKKPIPCLTSYILAIGSNEIALMLPFVFILVGWFKNFWPRELWLYFVTLPAVVLWKLVIGLPTTSDYALSLNFLPTLRWYFFRAINFPESIQRVSSVVIYFPFIIFLTLLLFSLARVRDLRLIVFSVVFFLLSALPFFFLPSHMSSYYLTMALFGSAILFSRVTNLGKLGFVAAACYLLVTILGLDFLSQTHWIILKNTGPIGQF